MHRDAPCGILPFGRGRETLLGGRVWTSMRTMRPDDGSPSDDEVPLFAPAPFPSEAERGVDARRRVVTLASFALVGLLGLIAWLAWPNAEEPAGERPSASADAPAAAALEAGTYRLPGLSTPVSVTVPDGWVAGASIWGSPGPGFAALSTGRPGASISIAVLDLDRLLPVDPSGGALEMPGDLAWFARSFGDYRQQVEPRVRDRVVGRRLDWRPPAVLAWLLTFTRSGPIDVADDVSYDGRRGDLTSFAFPGPRRAVFEVPGGGALMLRPGVTYTFWVPRRGSASDAGLMLGVARELGAPPTTAEWDVVRTLDLGP
jgi:hypothetical protein